MSQVRCSTCGFLALRNFGTRELIEAEKTFRDDGAIPSSGNCEPIPNCFRLATDFHSQISTRDANYVRPVIQKERECSDFTPWKQGFSPKEHQEMLDRQWMLDFQAKREDEFRQWQREADDADKRWRDGQAQADREWRHKQDADDKKWRNQQAKDDRDWRETLARNEERRHKVNLVVYGLLAIIAGIVGAAIQANWIPNLFGQPPT